MAAAVVLAAACSDSTAPNVQLDDAQVDDMMEAFSALGTQNVTPTNFPANMAAVTLNVNASVECPQGGTRSYTGSWTVDDETDELSHAVTHDFAACRATAASTGRVWTFDGEPNIVSTFNISTDPTSEVTTFTGTQTGGVRFTSDLGTGVCNLNTTTTMTLTPAASPGGAGSFTLSITGTVCGRSVEFALNGIE
jgi:hypothetical protein